MSEQAEKKANHRVNVIRIIAGIVRKHPDPETTELELIDIPSTSYQVVVRKGQFSIGDYGVFVQPDSVVPQTPAFKFLWGSEVTENEIEKLELVPESKRRITVRKFRKQWSEGLLLPIVDFPELVDERGNLKAGLVTGDDVSDLIGVTHYDPEVSGPVTQQAQASAPKRKFKYPKSIRGWYGFIKRVVLNRGRVKELTRDVSFWLPTYDVESLRNHSGFIRNGEQVVVTEKIHGSNARFIWLDDDLYIGSRNQWKAKDAAGPWGNALKSNPWIESWCRENPGFALYGEIAPTQVEGGIKFDYGAAEGQTKFFAFDVFTPEKEWLEREKFDSSLVAGQVTEAITAPVLYEGPFILEKILPLVNGPSTVHGAKHIREGIVIKTYKEQSARGLGRLQLKVVSNAFLDLANKGKR